MSTIGPCPFCGSAGTVEPWEYGRVAVHCSNLECGAIGPQRPELELAIELWNRLWVVNNLVDHGELSEGFRS
jgi:hypothetical protein